MILRPFHWIDMITMTPPCFVSITTIVISSLSAILITTTTTITTSHAFPIPRNYYYHYDDDNDNRDSDKQHVPRNPPPPPPSSPRFEPWFRGSGGGGFNPFAGRLKTCDEVPAVCGAGGRAGAPDCCGKTCVNLAADVFNCGRCGRRCRFGEMCCGGRCVNVFYDRENCGLCGNACKAGGFCRYGMCDYAL